MSVQLSPHRAKVEDVKIPQLDGTLRVTKSNTCPDPVFGGGMVE
ncbi:hypothetical protein GCM10023190_07460 [Enteractinococcus fodinae]|uniref:Uncharacterized protein n=1 Tax=Enteractinococcus fodinae TaxID=684663 RepID=A0ABU2AZK4_9MICC|nr:hypothetical protein [Enteractinococcus fodinae]